jgi:hypothetical protein
MKKLIILALLVFALFTSCQQRPQVFGVYIDGTFDQFMEDLDKEPWVCPVRFDSVYRISENQIAIQAYSTEIIGLNEDSAKIDSIHFTIELEQEKIKHFAYTMHMSETDFRAIQHAYERIYGNARYHDVTEYSHYCYWMIGRTCLWLSYDIADKQTKYEYIIN